MAGMRTETGDPQLRWRWLSRTLLAVLVATALGTVIFMIEAAGGVETFATVDGVVTSVLFIAWNLAPIFAMALAVLLTQRFLFRAVWVIAAGVVVLVSLTTWGLFDYMTNESSTAALLFLFGPVYQFLVVTVSLGAAAAVHALRGRPRRTQAPTAA